MIARYRVVFKKFGGFFWIEFLLIQPSQRDDPRKPRNSGSENSLTCEIPDKILLYIIIYKIDYMEKYFREVVHGYMDR